MYSTWKWDTPQEFKQLSQTTGMMKTPPGGQKEIATDLLLPMTETTNDSELLKTPVCLERQQYENIPDEYSQCKRKLKIRTGILWRENNRPLKPMNNRYHPITQRAPCHQQFDTGGETHSDGQN